MDMDKNMVLVKAVEKFPCLYKSDSIEYMRKPYIEQAWLEVSKETNLTVQECKEKWKNLRYGLLRSLRPTPHGSAKKRYYLRNEMEFLIPYMGNSTTKSKEKTEDFDDDDQGDPVEDNRYEITHVVETYMDEDEPIDKKPKINNETPYKHQEEEDSRKMFLLSLLPEIADFSENQMKSFRRRIFGLIDEINELDPL